MPDISPVAAELHRESIVVDTHDDLLMLCVRRAPAEQGAYFRRQWLQQLHAGGVRIQVLPVFIEDEFRPEGALRQTLRMLETGWRIAAANPDAVRICLNGAEIDAALADGLVALVLALEGARRLARTWPCSRPCTGSGYGSRPSRTSGGPCSPMAPSRMQPAAA